MSQSKKTWSTRWNGHTIVVENWYDWRLRNGENVFVDGDLVCEHLSAWNAISSILEADIYDESGAHRLRVEIGTSNGVHINCRIFVDGELVGGDSEKNFLALTQSATPPETPLALPARQKQLKQELFFRAVVAPLILIPLCDMMDLYLGNRDFSLLLFVVVMLFINVLQTVFKWFKLWRESATEPPKSSTPV